MKFLTLFRKELKELLTPSTIITTIIMVAILALVGKGFGSIVEEAAEEMSVITICDKDGSEISKSLIKQLTISEVDEETGAVISYDDELVKEVELQSDDYPSELDRLDINSLIILPEGFGEALISGKECEILSITRMNSSAALANINLNDAIIESIEEVAKTLYISNKGVALDDIIKSETLIKVSPMTIVGNKSASVSATVISSLTSMQNMFVPIIVYLLIIYSAQLIMNAVSTEKIDKTLETLLSAPVSRLSVLLAKMLAAGVVAAFNAIAYMIGFRQMMDSMTGGKTSAIDESGVDMSHYLTELGLNLSFGGYLLLGLQLFVTVLITLAIALVLGALAKDAKSAQSLLMPIMFMAMVPYIMAMVIDFKQLNPIIQLLVYAIPYTHTFTATENIMYSNMELFWGGFAYQCVLLVICMFIAVKIFTTDRIFTVTLSFSGKRKTKKKK